MVMILKKYYLESSDIMNKELEHKINSLIKNTKANIISSETLYKGNFIDLIEEDYLLPNNVVIKRERIIKNNNKEAVIVIVHTINDKYLLVVQNRINNLTTIEFPSGYIEEGENPIEAGLRELLEETGYISYDVREIDSYYNSLGMDSSIVHIIFAYNCEKFTTQNLGKYEYIKYDEFSLEELKELMDNNYINGVGNKLAYYELLNILNKTDKKIKRKIL